MPRGTQLLRYPWGWLTDFLVADYEVRPTVQPTVDVTVHNPEIQIFRQQFVMGAGNNAIYLPGLGRGAALNPAAFPTIQSKGARRWLSLCLISDTSLVAGKDIVLSQALSAAVQHELAWITGANTWPVGDPIPFIRGSSNVFNGAGGHRHGLEGSAYVPDPMLLFFQLYAQVGGEVIVVSGLYIESETENQPLPDMMQ
ncbi:MAG: hypothetical protein ACFFD1_16640 [Candidatus Thorarchaeota archaeon]